MEQHYETPAGRWGDGMGFEEEQVLADADLTFKEDVQQLQDPSPRPEWKRRRKRARCLRSAVLHGAWWSIQVQQKCQTRAPGSRTPTLALHAPAAVRAAGTCPERQGRHPFLPPARLCSGPVCKVHSAACAPRPAELRNRWNYVSVRDLQSVYSLARFIYQVWD